MEHLWSAVNKVIEKSTSRLVREDDLQRMLADATGLQLQPSEVKQLRHVALQTFQQRAKEGVCELVEQDKIDERLAELADHIRSSSSDHSWRPSGYPVLDVVLHKLPELVKAESRLQNANDALQHEMEEEQEQLRREKMELLTLSRSFGFPRRSSHVTADDGSDLYN